MWWARLRKARFGSSRASSAIRWSLVETVSGVSGSVVFPSSSSVSQRPLPSAGSLGSVPPPHRYYWGTPTPRRPSPLLRCLRSVVPRLTPSFALAVAGACLREPGHLVGRLPFRQVLRGDDGVSQVPGRTLARVPHAQTPEESPCLALSASRCCRRTHRRRWLPHQLCLSRFHRVALALAVYASWGGSPHRCTQDSLPAGG
jgi:hypothetical protein